VVRTSSKRAAERHVGVAHLLRPFDIQQGVQIGNIEEIQGKRRQLLRQQIVAAGQLKQGLFEQRIFL
jgi:hypothetical protein